MNFYAIEYCHGKYLQNGEIRLRRFSKKSECAAWVAQGEPNIRGAGRREALKSTDPKVRTARAEESRGAQPFS
jgi:hypothetical protein